MKENKTIEQSIMLGIGSIKTIRNGGIEQAILEAVNEDGGLSDIDKERLKHLQSLNPNRAEFADGTLVAINVNYNK